MKRCGAENEMIVLDNVSKIYGVKSNPIQAADNLSLKVARGEFVVIYGRSGSGKTTLLNLSAGMTRPDTGSITLNGQNLSLLSDQALSRLRAETVGFIFQFPSMIKSLSVEENVLLPNLFSARRDAKENARILLRRVGLEERTQAKAHELSAGQERRVGVARALLNNPPLLLCDEPTGDLDAETETMIVELIREAHAQGATVVMATHNRDFKSLATKVLTIENGKILTT